MGLGALPGVCLLVGACFLPESPRWLVTKGRDDDARMVSHFTYLQPHTSFHLHPHDH